MNTENILAIPSGSWIVLYNAQYFEYQFLYRSAFGTLMCCIDKLEWESDWMPITRVYLVQASHLGPLAVQNSVLVHYFKNVARLHRRVRESAI